jgi:hypothetical protein
MTEPIERQIECFAPGFGATILARQAMRPADFERYNPNYVGGDINGGREDIGQLFTRQSRDSYRTPRRRAASISAPRPPRRAEVCTGCADWAAPAALRAVGPRAPRIRSRRGPSPIRERGAASRSTPA